MLNILKKILMILALAGTAGAAGAGQLPGYYPGQFDHKGVVTRAANGQTIMINAMRYKLDSNVRVHSLTTEFSSVRALTAGSDIAYRADEDRNGKVTVTEIWVLPSGSVPRL